MLRTFLVRDKTRRRGDVLRLLARVDILEVHLLAWPVQAPRRRVVGACGLVQCLERTEAKPDVAGPNLGRVPAVGALVDAAVARRSSAARRHGGASVAGRWSGGGAPGSRSNEKAVEARVTAEEEGKCVE